MSTKPTTPDLTDPVVGQPIAIAFFDGNHLVHFSVAHVLSVGAIDELTGKPTISVAYPDPGADPSVLANASWYRGYARRTGIQHFSHPDVQASRVSIAYGNPQDIPAASHPELPKPAGDGENPVFSRADDILPTHVSLGQAASVQSAKNPRETVVSPLTSDLAAPFLKHSGVEGEEATAWTETKGAGVTDDTTPLQTPAQAAASTTEPPAGA
jgi:hypothetical protein